MADMLTLPAHCRIEGWPLKFRTKLEDRAFSHGALSVGDNKAESRSIEVSAYIAETSDAAYWKTHNEMVALFDGVAGHKFYLDGNHYLNATCLERFNHEFYQGFPLRKARLGFTLRCADPLIYAQAVSSQVVEIATSPTTFAVINSGGVEVFPTITTVASADNAEMSLENTTDDGRKFEYEDANFVTGATLTVNGEDGTVYLNTSNTLNFYSGAFLRLLPGSNSLVYTGGLATITLSWRNRWL
jgi:phage-related protein